MSDCMLLAPVPWVTHQAIGGRHDHVLFKQEENVGFGVDSSLSSGSYRHHTRTAVIMHVSLGLTFSL